MNNYVFGIGVFANLVAEKLERSGFDVNGLIWLKDFYMPIPIEENKKLSLLYAEESINLVNKDTNIIIAQKPIIMGDTIEFLKKNGFKNVYIASEELFLKNPSSKEELMKYFYYVNMERPFLNYLEMNIVDHCNLNCKGCAHFSNIYDRNFVSLESFEKDIAMVSNIFDLYYFRILGGEPLLHPNLIEILKIARAYLRNTNIVLVTNGLLINKLNKDVLRALHDYNITVCISVYTPTLKNLAEIENILSENGINYILNDGYDFNRSPIDMFQTRLTTNNDNNGNISSRMCLGRFCRFLRDGKITKCYYPLLIEILNKNCRTNYILSRDDYIELTSISDGWEAIEKLNCPIPFCDYCGIEGKNFSWSGYHKNDYDIEQYVLKRKNNIL